MEEVRSSGRELLKLMVDVAGDGVWPAEALCRIISASARLRESQGADYLRRRRPCLGSTYSVLLESLVRGAMLLEGSEGVGRATKSASGHDAVTS